jgi:hypothetical protein
MIDIYLCEESAMEQENTINYFEKFMKILIAHDKRVDKNLDEMERLTNEIFLIDMTRCAEMLCNTYSIINFCKEHNEPYIVCGAAASLYSLYLLGLTKINPVDIHARYETFLGTRQNPKIVNNIEIKVRPAFQKELFDYVEYVISKDGHGVDQMYTIKISAAELLEDFKDVNRSIHYLEGLSIIKKELLDGNAASLGITVDPRELYDIKEDITLNDVISLISRAHATTEGLTNRPITPFEDRDSVFNYYHDENYLDKEKSYQIMEDARKGISLQPYLEKGLISKEEFELLSKIKYLFPRAHGAECAYYYLLRLAITK